MSASEQVLVNEAVRRQVVTLTENLLAKLRRMVLNKVPYIYEDLLALALEAGPDAVSQVELKIKIPIKTMVHQPPRLKKDDELPPALRRFKIGGKLAWSKKVDRDFKDTDDVLDVDLLQDELPGMRDADLRQRRGGGTVIKMDLPGEASEPPLPVEIEVGEKPPADQPSADPEQLPGDTSQTDEGPGAQQDDDDGEPHLPRENGFDEGAIALAVEIIKELRRASISSLQRRMKLSFARAAALMDVLEARGIVGPAQGGQKTREILITFDDQASSAT